MPGYTGFQKKKSKLGTTLIIVAVVHIGIGGGLYWLSQTEFGQNLIKVYKLNVLKKDEKPPELPPPPEKEPEPEPPPPPKPEPKQDAPPPPPEAAAPPPPSNDRPTGPPPVDTSPFAIGKGKKFSGYADILTASIQSHYQQPAALPDDLEYAVLCELMIDEEGRVLQYRLVNSSGSLLFDQSAIDAMSKLTQVRPPPPGMDRTIVVKFYPPT